MPASPIERRAADSETPEDDFDVSDLESDLEPEEMISVYLRTKTKLFETRPDVFTDGRKGANKKKNKPSIHKYSGIPKPSQGVSKLQQKLQTIERDLLFDEGEAEVKWLGRRDQLLHDQANRLVKKRSESQRVTATTEDDQCDEAIAQSGRPNGEAAETEDDASDELEDGALGDLFAALPSGDLPRAEDSKDSEDLPQIVIRDFGQTKGLEPRRVLEDCCRARDPGARLRYDLVSSAAFANRHKLRITWSKDQRRNHPLPGESVQSSATARATSFTMRLVATPDSGQSIAYISVFALFQIFSGSSREEKAHLRLPSNWRYLWNELSELDKTQALATDREGVRSIQDLVRTRGYEKEDEDVIFTKNFQRRNENVSSSTDGKRGGATPEQHLEPAQIRGLWVSKASTASFQRMLTTRSKLPMWHFKQCALETVEQHQVTIVCGETGCGKSTQMPAYILEQELSNGRPCKIYCTEPRRISAVTLAQRVSEELGEQKRDLGTPRSLVGYAIRLETQTSSSTRLIYATTGIVLRMLESPEGFTDVSHIIIDEVHERSIETDFLLIVLQSLITQRPHLKVILMSATVDAQRFANYFGSAPVLNVPGRTFPVQTKFLEDAIEITGHVAGEDNSWGGPEQDEFDDMKDGNTTEEAVVKADLRSYAPQTRKSLSNYDHYKIDYPLISKLIESVASSPSLKVFSQAVLVFLPGLAEIRRMSDVLSASSVAHHFQIHTLHSSIASEDQQRAFAIPPHGMRKIVLSTNIAETGVTIPDITCVIDTGKHKEMRFDERRQVSRLIQSFISRANAKQRRGRAGRVQEGLCFHLFTKSRHDHLIAEQQTPEMLRLSLQDLIMRVKICKLGDIQATLAKALDPPSARNIRRSIDTLIEVSALTSQEELTLLGHQLSKLPLDPYLGKLVLFGALFGCLDMCLTLAAMLTSKTPFVAPVGSSKQADIARSAFKKGESDLLTDHNTYAAWRRVCTTNPGMEQHFCRKNFLNPQSLANVEDLKAQLLSNLADSGFIKLDGAERHALSRVQNTSSSPYSRKPHTFVQIPSHLDLHSANTKFQQAVISWAFYPKLLLRDGNGWRHVANNQAVSLHPTSILRLAPPTSTPMPRFLSFYSILQSATTASKNYNANSITPANPFALVLLVGGKVEFHPTAHVVSVDGARLRFSLIDYNSPNGTGKGSMNVSDSAAKKAFKTLIALKYLRKRLDDVVRLKWKKGGVGGNMPADLENWWCIWEELVKHWEGENASTGRV